MFESINRTAEKSLLADIEGDRVASHIDFLADLQRYPGTSDEWELAEYITDTLDSYGIMTEMHTVDAYTSVPESASITVTTPQHREADHAITTAFSANTPKAGLTGEIVRIEGTTDETDLARVEDKIALVTGLPSPAPIRSLEAAGADAVVFQSVTEKHTHEMIVSPVWGTPSEATINELPDLPVVEISHADGEWLSELVAGDDVEATLHTETTTGLTELPCPVGHIDGTESDRYFMIGNHIDSWYEGVTDNGTAVAAALELARLFADNPPKRGVRFGFWPGHSMGRYAGSAWYADNHWLDLRENCIGYLHIDLNGLNDANQIWYQHMGEVAEEHIDILETASFPLIAEADDDDDGLLGPAGRPGRSSDQSFWGAGVSSLLSGARFSADHEDAGPIGGGWWWHTPADTRDKVDMDVLTEELELYTGIISRFCHSPVLPHDFRETCEDVRTALADIKAAADDAVDFGVAHDRLDELETNLDIIAADLDTADGSVDTALEDVQVTLGNELIPALYMENMEYEHDPALPHQLLPYLRVAENLPNRSGARKRFVEVSVQRGITKLTHRIQRANDAVEVYLDG